ncbi:uncharacterized protein LOC123328852 [Bubalus bubalis]|uniref:uncharacterized protein LOC123328852 n=1 Tax=Bubalus bubalis TaxID=89462 RepID=UPI001E1B99D2|nr:uncharacterized protein LOC123328852 [Bubalus bubalis]
MGCPVPRTVQSDRASRFPSPAAPSCWPRNAKSEEVLACIGDAAAQGRGKRDAPYRSPISSFLLHFSPSHCQLVACSLALSLLRPWRDFSERMHTKTPSRLLPEPAGLPPRPGGLLVTSGTPGISRSLLAPFPAGTDAKLADSELGGRTAASPLVTRRVPIRPGLLRGGRARNRGRGLVGGGWRGHWGPSHGEKMSPAVPVSRHLPRARPPVAGSLTPRPRPAEPPALSVQG